MSKRPRTGDLMESTIVQKMHIAKKPVWIEKCYASGSSLNGRSEKEDRCGSSNK